MFLGHFAVGLAAKRLAPDTSLGTLFAAAQLLDLAWPVLVLVGAEEVRVEPGNTAFTPLDFVHYPWTHSLLMAAVWAVAFAVAYRSRTGKSRAALVVGLLVASHWVLDFATHRPDLPLAPGATKVGLGLWNSIPATLVVESAMYLLGAYLYATATRPRNRAGRLALAALLVFLAAIYVASVTGPPPPGATPVAIGGLMLWLLVPWAAWVDRNRESRLKEERAPLAGAPGFTATLSAGESNPWPK